MPSTVEKVSICTKTGLLATRSCNSVTEYFDTEGLPKKYCSGHFFNFFNKNDKDDEEEPKPDDSVDVPNEVTPQPPKTPETPPTEQTPPEEPVTPPETQTPTEQE